MKRAQARDFIRSELERYLQNKGINTHRPFHCLNPGHNDRNPSMSFDSKRNKAHCFSCGVDWDTFDIIGAEYGLSGSTLFQKAYELFGLEVEGEQYTHKGIHSTAYAKKEGERDYTVFFDEAQRHIGETDYPQRRGLSEAIIDRFGLGYIEKWRHPNVPSNVPASPRLIIPTSKHSYLARDTRSELMEDQKKYSKSKVGKVRLFNVNALKEATKPVFITEGELDALSIMTVGGEAIALGSAANVQSLIKLIQSQKPAQPLIVALDNDPAGEKAAEELIKGLEGLYIPHYRINPYGEHKDANEALTTDRDALAAAVESAERVEEEAILAEREAYAKTNVLHHLQSFIDGISDSVNTPFIPTGFKKLDEVFDGGLYEGLYIVGAISSLGKTTIMLQITDQIAQQGHDVIIFSLEMARSELIAKSVSRHTIIDVLQGDGDVRNAKTARGITTGKRYSGYSTVERELIKRAINEYAKYAENIYISEGMGDIGAEQVRETVRKHIHFTENRPVIVVDYLQILAPYSERATDKQVVDKAVMELKRISRDFKIPVIAISSFNRQNYSTAVTMEAFKESGAVEYSSDVLIGLQLMGAGKSGFDSTAEKKKNPRNVELVILKNRNGAAGDSIPFEYYPLFNYFKES